MFCLSLSLPTGRECTTTKDILVSCSNLFGRSLVALLHSCSRDLLANKRGCALSFYTYVKRIFDLQCQQVSRIRSRRRVRPSQTYSLRNRLHSTNSQNHSLSSSLTGAYQNRSRRTASIVVPYPYSASGVMTSLRAVTPQCTISRRNSKLCKTSIVSDRPFFPCRFDRRHGSQ